MKQLVRLSSVLLVAAAVGGCSNAGLQPVVGKITSAVDDLLEVDGEVCSSAPTEQVFPVKIMFIVDASGSMQLTDPSDATASGCQATCAASGVPNCASYCASAQNPGRQAAVQKVVDRFKNNPAVSFAMIRFNGRITVNGGSNVDGFTNDPTVLRTAIDGLAQADITTDYQGALSMARQILEKDMVRTDPAERARTKYVVIFLSDGGPNPVCKAGCGNDLPPGGLNPAIIIDRFCDVPPNDRCPDGYTCPDFSDWYPFLNSSYNDTCQEYNTPEELTKLISEMVGLADQYGVGELRLHTAFLFVDGLPDAILQLLEINKADAETLLQLMAKAGGGVYRSFNAGQKIDFLDINYSSISRPFGMTNFIVTNRSSIPEITKLGVDTDGDGLDDETEFQAGTDPQKPDTDGDGYGDKLEYTRRDSGFDPLDPNVPVRRCPESERIDRDGDGLTDCEEAILGTDPKIVDSDRDRFPDGVEFFAGTDPGKVDNNDDPDFDGKLSGEEIKIHSSPIDADPDIQANFRYLYDVTEGAERADLRRCYTFKVRQVHLVTSSQENGAGSAGYNDILVYFGEGPADDPRDFGNFKAACVRAQYVAPAFKDPPNGLVQLTVDDFYPLPELLQRRATREQDPSAKDPCVGAKHQ